MTNALDCLRNNLAGVAEAIAEYARQIRSGDYRDEPTITDNYGNETPISEWPLDIVDERGKEFAVLIAYGGPNIWLTADGLSDARLVGYWGSETVTLWDDSARSFTTVLDYFIDR